MRKKIIALSLVLVIMAICFTACGEKYLIKEINGKEYVLATDAEGNTIVSDDNKIGINPTDANGKVILDSEGNPQINWVEVNAIEGNDFTYLQDYRLRKVEGWTFDGQQTFNFDGTDGKRTFKLFDLGQAEGLELAEFKRAKTRTQNEENIVPAMEKEGFTVEINEYDSTITEEKIPAYYLSFTVKDAEGKLVHFAEEFYFNYGGRVYSASHACADGVSYDANFDFNEFLNANFIMKKI